MKMFTVTIIDTSGIQDYIFSSNRLRENIGASQLVSEVCNQWLKTILLQKLGLSEKQLEQPIESSNLDAELVYSGGGNALLISKSREIAVDCIGALSRKILEDAPGINLIVAHEDFNWDKNNLSQIVEDLIKVEIESRKNERIPSVPILGLGVTLTCDSTQLPAVDSSQKYVEYDEEDETTDSYLISTETRQKLKAVPRAKKELQEIFSGIVDRNIYKFPLRTDHLGRSYGESSYTAIIHADGNSMGKRFQKYGHEAKTNREYIQKIRELSKSVHNNNKAALRKVAEVVIKSIEQGKIVGNLGEFLLNGNYYLPFRPLVFGGDDITLICEGRLGIELAALFLKEIEKTILPDGEKMTACAGVCVVKTHYPFARAYQVSEELCSNAKKFVKSKKQFEPDGFSALDWHLAASGLTGSITEIREREYKIKIDNKTQNLAMRPLRLNPHYSEWRTWDFITKVIREFKEGEDWKDRKNKVMALREILREGSEDAVKDFLRSYNLPSLPNYGNTTEQIVTQGWLNGVCGYFDAIEAMDFYISLEE
ncbi:hypothetical protein PN497_02530 [Sphaerospermopsis kisseleviana CS-549]|uniref:Cas10/Cmr2 second palm domain-containing protein n=3 Tax=Sphaerospermopsis TaxID=752201 RepID=A0A479ZTE3_9CYAN|nr:hypothetical protein [Sphaerospermopsis kisseleviana]MDB9440261.1 hypothetical protein [Sphaerospermopsis kisseleviana CS-549]BAZ83609.1 hypothetical protein NIES73_48980 [Sphaerospermopsis kisseleviana NIES-73]GCL35777.1 hypothetical protein SR1949_08760 [Sphaerospermopsis reniformis]